MRPVKRAVAVSPAPADAVLSCGDAGREERTALARLRAQLQG
jgi:hypothetical protein